ncbi:hypothetical protein [Streptomyces sp. HNM0574]|uniref:hypothetical protein n=1 Tax=Streptomyces sp. HNM0574 TaxID=2714954 RepID=UPI00146C8E8C|nr:hypothetical protein [Streptomyces sp. HNM0574]NLU70355.1 hypothetical protein [Streptomyces sp. HNM0574]
MIDGVSAATLAEIHRLERAWGLPGEAARDLACWKLQAAAMCSRRRHHTGPVEQDEGGGHSACPHCFYGPPEGRWGLEHVLRSLSRRARREFAAVVGAVDLRVLNATYGADPEIPGWWERRF